MSQSSFRPRSAGPEIVPAEYAEDAEDAEDQEPPSGGGVFRRLGAASGAAGVSSVFEVLFHPSQKAAREEIQRQRRVGKQNPSATDPPEDGADGAPEGRVAACGRPNTPYSGWIVLDVTQE